MDHTTFRRYVLLGESPLPRRIIEPLKLGMAIMIIYAIAFYMGWNKPYWATVSAISVTLVSQSMTINRGFLRTLGCLIGGLIGFVCIAMFPQERWAYMAAASVVLAILGYLATAPNEREPYFFLVIFITFMVIIGGLMQADYTDSGSAFYILALRVSQTGMGSLVAVLIAVYVFPIRTIDEFEDLARARWSFHRQMFDSYHGMLLGQPEAAETKHLRLEDAPLLDYMNFRLHGAMADSFDMLAVHHDWHHYMDLGTDQFAAMESLRDSLNMIRESGGGLDLEKFIPNLKEVGDEIAQRFEQTERMLNKKAPTYYPQELTVELNEAETRALPHFQEAAVRVIKQQIEKLAEVNLSMFDCLTRIRMLKSRAGAHHGHHGHGAGGRKWGLDPFRVRGVAALVLSLWVAYFIWIYVYDMPKGSLYVTFTIITGGIAMYRPESNHPQYFGAWMAGALIAGIPYLFIMQHLSGHLQFGIMIVIVVFIAQYALFNVFHPMARIFTSIGIMLVLDAENHQAYDLQTYLQTVLWMSLAIFTGLAVRWATFIPLHQDKRFMMALDQFFRHANFLLSEYNAEGKRDRSLSRRLRSIFYRHSLLKEAERLSMFAGQADTDTAKLTYKLRRGSTPEQLQELIRTVYALGHRVEALVEARAAWRSNAVDKYVMDEKREWHRVMQQWFQRPPGEAQATGPAGDLPARLADLETRIDEAFTQIREGELSTEDYENFYRRLGHYRGLSEAALDFARVAKTFDWPQWRETRF